MVNTSDPETMIFALTGSGTQSDSSLQFTADACWAIHKQGPTEQPNDTYAEVRREGCIEAFTVNQHRPFKGSLAAVQRCCSPGPGTSKKSKHFEPLGRQLHRQQPQLHMQHNQQHVPVKTGLTKGDQRHDY